MTREQLAKIRQRASDPTLKWNILMAQSDREALLPLEDFSDTWGGTPKNIASCVTARLFGSPPP